MGSLSSWVRNNYYDFMDHLCMRPAANGRRFSHWLGAYTE